jgi:hypothetical protein
MSGSIAVTVWSIRARNAASSEGAGLSQSKSPMSLIIAAKKLDETLENHTASPYY